jgi:hypothetical protein
VEGRRHRSVVGLTLACALFAATAPHAVAYEQHEDVNTDNEGVNVVVTVGEDGSASAHGGNGGGGGGGGGGGCEWSVIQYPFTGQDPPANYGAPPTAEHNLYLIYCDGEFVGAEWIAPRERATIVDVVGEATTVIERIPVDLAQIGARPQGRAVTGIPSYFWVEGYSGAPIEGSVVNGPVTVDVSVTLGTVTWDFGDGTPAVTGGLGEAWPNRSSIRHAYRNRGTYNVTVTIVMPAAFTVNDGAPVQLEPVVRTATIPYVVDEVQAVRNR